MFPPKLTVQQYRPKYRKPSKSDTNKIPIPKKLLVTPWYTTLVTTNFCALATHFCGSLFSWVRALRKKLATLHKLVPPPVIILSSFKTMTNRFPSTQTRSLSSDSCCWFYSTDKFAAAPPQHVRTDNYHTNLTRTRGHDRLIKINKILIKINKILHRPPLNLHGTGGRGLLSWPCLCPGWQFFSNKHSWWIVGLYTTPHSIFMAPAVGGVAHVTVNARAWAEGPWTAHRRRWWPWLAVPRMTNFFVKNWHGGLLEYVK